MRLLLRRAGLGAALAAGLLAGGCASGGSGPRPTPGIGGPTVESEPPKKSQSRTRRTLKVVGWIVLGLIVFTILAIELGEGEEPKL